MGKLKEIALEMAVEEAKMKTVEFMCDKIFGPVGDMPQVILDQAEEESKLGESDAENSV